MDTDQTVFLIDDDANIRDALKWLIESISVEVRIFDSAAAFLDAYEPTWKGCLILDVRMPGMSGLELQDRLISQKIGMPIIVMTGHADVPMCIRAFEGGAFAFVEKPVNHQQLLDHIHRAFEHNRTAGMSALDNPDTAERLRSLTPRESEVMERITAGMTMKQIASELEIGIQTCSKHRARVLEKLDVDNDVELVRLLLASDRAL